MSAEASCLQDSGSLGPASITRKRIQTAGEAVEEEGEEEKEEEKEEVEEEKDEVEKEE